MTKVAGTPFMVVAAIAASAVIAACSAGPRTPDALPPKLVRLTSQDGGVIYAHVYGVGEHGVVLAHGGRFSKESWAPQARMLAKAGFHVLAIDFRGYGQSRGPGQEDIYTAPLHLDVLAGVQHLHERGAKRVAVVGGSMGGGAAANAVAAAPHTIDRLFLIGATPDGEPEQLKVPKLYVMSRGDANSAGPRLPGLQAHFARAPEPKELIVLDGSAHAQFIFDTEHAERVMGKIVRFLSAHGPVGPAR